MRDSGFLSVELLAYLDEILFNVLLEECKKCNFAEETLHDTIYEDGVPFPSGELTLQCLMKGREISGRSGLGKELSYRLHTRARVAVLIPLRGFDLHMSSDPIVFFTCQLLYELDNFALRNRIEARLNVNLDEIQLVVFSVGLGQAFLEKLQPLIDIANAEKSTTKTTRLRYLKCLLSALTSRHIHILDEARLTFS